MNHNFIYLDWPCFGKEDVLPALESMGYTAAPFFHANYQERKNGDFDQAFDEFVSGKKFDFCFSFNFYPLVSEGCKRHDIPYISIVYDSPYVAIFSYTIINPNNYVFLFDSDLYLRLRKEGITTVYYMPLPVNPDRLRFITEEPCDRIADFTCDVSFVGSLYHEDHNFFDRLSGISERTRGYLDAIIAAQRKVYGYNFIEEVLTPEVIADMQSVIHYPEDHYGVQSLEYVYANYFIDRRITELERRELLNAAASVSSLKLFTRDPDAPIKNAHNMGTVDYYMEMPYIFRFSKINLNISLRSITSGIPLRCMDILGAGGFLLTNYQPDFLLHFTPDEDFVYFESKEDMLNKIEYYLSHEKERAEIAENGLRKIYENHTYEKVFSEIFQIVFP